MKRVVLYIAFLILSVATVSSQKVFKQIRTALKADPNAALAQAEKAKTDTTVMNNPNLYLLTAEVQRKINDVQNTNFYLKKQADSVKFFSSVYGIFDNLVKCDQLESIPDGKGRVKPKSRGKIRMTLKQYYPNLYSGSLFFFKKNMFKEADQYCSMYINTARSAIFASENLEEKDVKMPRVAFWSMTSCFQLKDYQGVFKFDDLAKRDTANYDLYLRYKSMAYSALNDLPNMVKTLKEGVQNMSKDLFFFSHLADYYNSTKDYTTGLNLCDSLIKTDTAQIMYKFAKSVVLFHQKKYDECRQFSKIVLDREPTNVDANYYMASSYFNEAAAIDDNINADFNTKDYNTQKAHVKELFEAALPYMEKYRQMRPEDSDRWAAPLYRMYLFLNKGKEFDEMDKLLKKIEADKKAQEEKAKAEAAQKK